MCRFGGRALALALVLTLFFSTTLPAVDWSAWAPANHAGLRWEGRVRFNEQGAAVFDWAQVRMHATFTGPQIAVYAETGDNYLDLVVDGTLRAILGREPRDPSAPLLQHWLEARSSGGNAYVLTDLGPGEHRLILAKRTGPNIGPVRMLGLRLGLGQSFLSAPAPMERRIEVIGDSLSVGYGAEAAQEHCHDLPAFENSSLSWARMVGEAVGADIHLLAFSGYGVVRNYGEKATSSKEPFPHFYPRTVLAERREPWDRSRFVPQVAISFLGSNDYSTKPVPSAEAFIAGYRDLLAEARKGRGDLPILCLAANDERTLQKRVQELVAQEQAAGLPTQFLSLPGTKAGEFGCDGHPKAVVQARWAAVITPKLDEMMNWTAK
jgi:lysophospholipase L1-like esterase